MIKEIYSNLAELEGCKTSFPSDVALSYHLLSELCFLLLLSHQKKLEVRYFVARLFLENIVHPAECCWWENTESFEKIELVKFKLHGCFFLLFPPAFTHVLFYILKPNTYLLSTSCIPDIVLSASVCFLWHNNLVSWFSSSFFEIWKSKN